MRQAEMKRAVELRAVKVATAHYRKKGYSVADTSSTQPYDLLCRKGTNVAHVEVKGATGGGSAIFLTQNELEHSRLPGVRTDLFVLGHIRVVGTPDGPRATGGKVVANRTNCAFDDANLVPIQWRYM